MTAMFLTLISALFLGSILSSNRNLLNAERATFNLWKLRYNKSYASLEEEETRFAHFQASVARVHKLQKASAKQGGAQFGLTKFADLSVEEFRHAMLMPRRTPDVANRKPAPKPLRRLRASPSAYDWRVQGKVTPVKNQEQCGSCWAFSATETIESAWMLKHKLNNVTMQPLAPQQIVDCDDYCLGCGGGQAFSALDYVLGSGGLETNANYPYQGVNGDCQFDSTKVYAKMATWEWACSIENEQELLDNTYNHGPTSICVDAANWQDYVSGVMTASQCAWINQLDHCVQAVGWNTAANPPYWIVRNSWTTQWGEEGYIRLQYGQNTCGLTYDATYVIAA